MFSLFTTLAKQSVMFVFKIGNKNSTIDYILFTKKKYFSNMIYRFYFANIWALLSVMTVSVFTMSCIAEFYKVENHIVGLKEFITLNDDLIHSWKKIKKKPANSDASYATCSCV